MNIQQWLDKASSRLKSVSIASARLDAELLLADFLKKPREYLIAHPEFILQEGPSFAHLEKNLARRIKREPMAYILGSKEFYGRTFAVTPDVLIPRPESETIIDLLKQIIEFRISNFEFEEDRLQIVDIGTGSGCLAISAKLEWPNSKIIAIDTSKKALDVAQNNARTHGAEVEFLHGSLLEPIPTSNFEIRNSILVANLPYVDKSWEVSLETKYEPSSALYSDEQGLFLIKQLLNDAPKKLYDNGYIILEADPRQHTELIKYSQKNYHLKQICDFIVVLQKK